MAGVVKERKAALGNSSPVYIQAGHSVAPLYKDTVGEGGQGLLNIVPIQSNFPYEAIPYKNIFMFGKSSKAGGWGRGVMSESKLFDALLLSVHVWTFFRKGGWGYPIPNCLRDFSA